MVYVDEAYSITITDKDEIEIVDLKENTTLKIADWIHANSLANIIRGMFDSRYVFDEASDCYVLRQK